MITNIRNIQTFTPDQLSNDDYHGEKYAEYASGSSLHLLFTECPAALKYGEHEESAALHFGTASHAAMLEPELFEKEFVKAIKKDDFEITSDAAIKAKLKAMGMTGYSTKKWPDLIIMLLNADPEAKIFALESWLQECECQSKGQTLVGADNYDMIMQMRETLFANPSNIELLKGAQVEMSVICEVEIDGTWHKVKIRPDIITGDRSVPDYKTTANMNPEKFGRQAHEAGYWFKQAFVCDILKAVYEQDFKAGLLAQGKKAPHIYQLYWLTGDQLQVGREQYQSALRMFTHCNESDVWPAYFDEPTELPTPGYVAKMYNI
jgi:hypothetical protein